MKIELRCEAFKKELAALLKKYDTALEANDEYMGYPECGENIQITAYIEDVYDDNFNKIAVGGNVRIGRYFDGK